MSLSDKTKLPEALARAQAAANTSGLPQTVYKTTETYGWDNTWFGALKLQAPRAKLHASILPTRYFVCIQNHPELFNQ